MKASKKINDQTPAVGLEKSLDPFAVDIFGVNVKTFEENLPELFLFQKSEIRKIEKADWTKDIPHLTNREVKFSNSIQNLPSSLDRKVFEIIKETISRITFKSSEKVELSVISVSEANLKKSLETVNHSSKIFFTIESQSTKNLAIVAINSDFASSVIDLVLGGKGVSTNNSGKLSPIEKSILQFLILNILREINDFIGAPILQLQNVTQELKSNFSNFERGAEIIANLEIDELSSIFNLITANSFLQNLAQTENPILQLNKSQKKLSYFENTINKLNIFLQIGTTSLDSQSLLFLEKDDIVLLEKPNTWERIFAKKTHINIGRGKNFRLIGMVEENQGELNFKVEEILSDEKRRKFSPLKFMIEENENQINGEKLESLDLFEMGEVEISPSLENLQISLRVEISGNTISLRELQNLRRGQIIALGCRPTDPVRLVTDNRDEPIAVGELIEIEGQLGVKLTKVFI